jgi:hypothetical protein
LEWRALGSIPEDVRYCQKIPDGEVIVGRLDIDVFSLIMDAVREEWEGTAVVREDEANVGEAGENAGGHHVQHAPGSVERIFEDGYKESSNDINIRVPVKL